MARATMDVADLRPLGGRLCLDFVNTVEDRAGPTPVDCLTGYADLVAWSRHVGSIDAEAAATLSARPADDAAAESALARAIVLREALHRVFRAIAVGEEPPTADLAALQRVYAAAVANARLTPEDARFVWTWASAAPNLDLPIWLVARSAIDLLTTGEARRIKLCANLDGCGWLFYDQSKNGSRRWCSMEGCGSQSKMRRQYAKRRAAGQDA
jgi:predicted RNA-binding Zn ribbon-like protein